MYACPTGTGTLVKRQTEGGVLWECDTCAGRAMTFSLMRRLRDKDAVAALWLEAKKAAVAEGRPCPSCTHGMHVVGLGEGKDHVELDVCLSCHFVFFDAGEFEQTPGVPEAAPEPEMPLEARRALAMAKLEAIQKTADEVMLPEASHPAMWLAMVFMLPVELGTHRVTKMPVVTWAVAALVLLVSGLAFLNLETIANDWGLVPSEAFRVGGLTLLTTFFLHAGVIHLLSNLYFLVSFGDNLEEVLGHGRYGLLLLAATLAGSLGHLLLASGSTLPAIGASGGVAGLLVTYAIRFPRARLGMLVFFRVFRVPVWAWLISWVAIQVLGAVATPGDLAGIAYGAHLGGALAGLVLGLIWRHND